MRFSFEQRYDAPADEVYAMLTDRSFRERVCVTGGALEHTVTITAAGDAITAVVDQTLAAGGIPSFATKMVGDRIRVVQTEEWSVRTAASLDVVIPGKPARLTGDITLVPAGTGTVEKVDGEVKVNIPFVGGKLEKLIADLVQSALRNEERVGRDWLTGKR